MDVLEVDDISIPEAGIVEITPDKFVSPSDELITLADVQQNKLEVTQVLSTWVQEPPTETSTNVNTAVECILDRSLSQTFDMADNLDTILGWNVPEVGSQEEVTTENNNDDNISVLIQVTDTAEMSTQTMFCEGVDSEIRLNLLVKPTETSGTQAGLHWDQYLNVETQTDLILKETEVVSTQTYLALPHIKDIYDVTLQHLNGSYAHRLNWINKLMDLYPETIELDPGFVRKIRLMTPEVYPGFTMIDDVKNWTVPVMHNLTGAFGVLVCPWSEISSPMELFRAFQEFSPCIPFIHEAFPDCEPCKVEMPMQVGDFH